MICKTMTHINALRKFVGSRDCVAWGKKIQNKIQNASASPLIFAAALIVCSLAVGCSSDKPKAVSANNQMPVTQAESPIAPAPAPAMQVENKPASRKVVHKKPATVNYTDKTYGVSFEYPRRYAIETGDAATSLLASSVLPMNFVSPGGAALAAVELPETGFANTDFSSAYFNVSVNKNLTADQCNEFAVPEPKVTPIEASTSPVANDSPSQSVSTQAAAAPVAPTQAASAQPASTADAQSTSTSAAAAAPATSAAESESPSESAAGSTNNSNNSNVESTSDAKAATSVVTAEPEGSKLILGDMQLLGTEAVSGEGTRQSDSKYFHVFQNGACYEFALNVTTVASDEGMTRHVDRDKVFSRLEKILSTVKINTVMPDATAETPAAAAVSTAPAQ